MCAPLHRSKLQSLAKTKAILSSTFCTRTGYCKIVGGRVNRVGAHRPCWLTHRKDLQSDQDRPGGSRRACISVLWSLWRPPPRRQSWRPRRRRSPRRSWKRLRFFLLRVRTDFVLTLTSFLTVSNSWKIIFWKIDNFCCIFNLTDVGLFRKKCWNFLECSTKFVNFRKRFGTNEWNFQNKNVKMRKSLTKFGWIF